MRTENAKGKLMKLIVASKLARDVEKRNILPPKQDGYRAGKSIRENAARSACDVHEGFERKNSL